jgi:hypothetical protein
MKKNGVRGVVAAAIVGVIATALPALGAGAATSAKCSSNQVDIGGTCTSKKDVAQQIVSITQGVMQKYDAKGVVLRVDVGNDMLVNQGLGESQFGSPVTPDMKWRPGSMCIMFISSFLVIVKFLV